MIQILINIILTNIMLMVLGFSHLFTLGKD